MSREQILSAIDEEISKLQQARKLLQSSGGSKLVSGLSSNGRKTRARRTLSPEARARIAAAQKRRWAKQKKEAA
jgi:hypothetical protein